MKTKFSLKINLSDNMEIETCFFDTSAYTVTDKKLGEGAFGKVFVVKSKTGEELYAAKIINTTGIFSSRDQMLFLRESLILHKLNHPSIVKFYGINLHSFDNPTTLSPTILTEYCVNGSLKVLLDKEKMNIADSNWSPTKKYICLLGISDAMRYLHRGGIIHRDLKAENILIDGNYYPKVCDFGLSRCFSESLRNSMQLSMTGQVGTPLYMAPELYESDEESYGPGVDVYAFAIMAYEIMTGQEAFSEKGKPPRLIDILRKVPNGIRPEFPEGVQENMKELIEKCWSQNASDRPSFDYIFKELSSDFSHSFETVDKDEINEYLAMLKELHEETEVEKIEKLEEELVRKDEDVKNLQNENAELKKENENHKFEIDQLRSQIEELTNPGVAKCLHVKICEAQKFVGFRFFGKSNPYVTIRLKSKTDDDSFCTKTILNTNNPVWNEEFNLITRGEDDALILNMYHEDEKGDERMMDEVELSANQFRMNGILERREIDIKLNNKKAGTLIIEIQAFPPIGEHSKPSGNSRINWKLAEDLKKTTKILILGGCSVVGITSLLYRYADDKFLESTYATSGINFKTHYIEVNGHKVKLQIWETAGRVNNRPFAKTYLRGAHGIIICYKVTDRESLESTQYWSEVFKEPQFDKTIPIVLSGNMIDLKEERKVSYEEGEQFASSHGWSYFETSAKDNIGVNELFQFIGTKSFMYMLNKK